jgi:cell division protein FtsZ
MDELGEVTDFIQEAAGQTADIIKGYGIDETLGDKINITLIATGFNANPVVNFTEKKAERIIRRLDEQVNQSPVVSSQSPVAPKQESTEPILKTAAEAETPVVPKQETVQEPFLKPIEAKESTSGVEFEIVKKTPEEQPIVPVSNTPMPLIQQTPMEPVGHSTQTEKVDLTDPAFIEEQRKKSQERIEKLKQLSYKLRTSSGISELENEPAYKRRNVELEDTQHSSESTMSRFTLSQGEDKKGELKENNSFLHDNVD